MHCSNNISNWKVIKNKKKKKENVNRNNLQKENSRENPQSEYMHSGIDQLNWMIILLKSRKYVSS